MALLYCKMLGVIFLSMIYSISVSLYARITDRKMLQSAGFKFRVLSLFHLSVPYVTVALFIVSYTL